MQNNWSFFAQNLGKARLNTRLPKRCRPGNTDLTPFPSHSLELRPAMGRQLQTASMRVVRPTQIASHRICVRSLVLCVQCYSVGRDPSRHVVTRELVQEEARLQAVPYERRDGDRYAIRMNVRCRRRLSGRRAAPVISAVVVDISSTGVLIYPAAGYRLGTVMELAIDWPVLYQRVFRMALAVTGSVVRNDARGTAIRITSHALKLRRARL
jgi:hypothetical protein